MIKIHVLNAASISSAAGAAIGALGSGVVSAVKSLSETEAPRKKKRSATKRE